MDIIGTKLAAELTGIAEHTLRYWRAVNEGPPSFKLGRRVVYRRADVEKWMAQQEAATRRGGTAAAL